ncbi:MAG: hypothetical protein JNM56_14310 [Planctomycetia bacterium]|nr:hypothetical protein [Planctomycetia bacterium]
MAGGMAAVLVMMFTLALNAIVGLWVAAYAAHCFLVTVEQTAAGGDAVEYPEESLLDWCWKVVYLLWLTAIWLVPLGLLHRNGYLDAPFLPLAVGFLWLTFPVCLFSSFGSESVLVIFRFDVLWRLLRHPLAVLSFYILTALLLATVTSLAYFTLIGWREVQDGINAGRLAWLSPLVQWWSWLLALPLTALMLAAGILWYGRLLGRLAAIINPRRRRRQRPLPDDESRPLPIAEAARALARSQSGADETAAPAFGRDETYGVQDDEPETAVEVVEDEKPCEKEEDEERQPPPGMWSSSVFRFPFYLRSLRVLAWLTADALVVLLLFRALAAVWAI